MIIMCFYMHYLFKWMTRRRKVIMKRLPLLFEITFVITTIVPLELRKQNGVNYISSPLPYTTLFSKAYWSEFSPLSTLNSLLKMLVTKLKTDTVIRICTVNVLYWHSVKSILLKFSSSSRYASNTVSIHNKS